MPVRITNRGEQPPRSGNNFGTRRIIRNHDNSVGIRKTNQPILNKKARDHCAQKCVLLNARSPVNKVNKLEIQVASHNSDITFVMETWLADLVPDEAVNCSGQNINKKDRPNGNGGGGIAV